MRSYSAVVGRAPGRWIQTPFAVCCRSAHAGGGGRPRSSSPSPPAASVTWRIENPLATARSLDGARRPAGAVFGAGRGAHRSASSTSRRETALHAGLRRRRARPSPRARAARATDGGGGAPPPPACARAATRAHPGRGAVRGVELPLRRTCLCARDSRGRHSRAGSPRRASRRRRSAPRARARPRSLRRRRGTPRSPPSPSRTPRACDARSIAPRAAPRPREATAAHEGGAGMRRRADLEVRRARARERAAAEEGAAQVGAAAARRARRRARRALERRVVGVRARPPRRGRRGCASVAFDVQLVAGLALERVAPVGADLRGDAQLARSANARRATGESARSRWNATAPRPRRCTVPAVWKSAESSASRSHRRVGAIAASSARTSSASEAAAHSRTPSSARRRRLSATPGGAVAADPVAPPRPGDTA